MHILHIYLHVTANSLIANFVHFSIFFLMQDILDFFCFNIWRNFTSNYLSISTFLFFNANRRYFYPCFSLSMFIVDSFNILSFNVSRRYVFVSLFQSLLSVVLMFLSLLTLLSTFYLSLFQYLLSVVLCFSLSRLCYRHFTFLSFNICYQ